MTLNEEENVCGLVNLGDGYLEECVDSEMIKYVRDFDDYVSDNSSQDIAAVLPDDPFEMDSDPILPRDPFGMDFVIEATVEVITDWDLGVKGADEVVDDNDDDNRIKVGEDDSGGDNSFVAHLNFVLADWETVSDTENSFYIVEDSMCFGCEKYEIEHVKDENNGDGGLKSYGFETDEVADVNSSYDNRLKAAADDCGWDNGFLAEVNFSWRGYVEYGQEDGDSMCSGCDKDAIVHVGFDNDEIEQVGCDKDEIEHVKDENNGDGGAAVDMIIFVLRYLKLGVKDLLTIEMVCKSLRDGVRKDPYLWTTIHVDHSLRGNKIGNDVLMRLTDRAQGRLCSLGLERCFNVTIDGLQQVLGRNLGLTKLSVAGCNKLTLEGVMYTLKAFNSVAKPGIKCLRIADIKNPIPEPTGMVNELKRLLGADETAYKPRFYSAEMYLSLDDEHAIDIETCPRCKVLKQVYDCPSENCRVTSHSTQTCKACILCTKRCIQCGCCLERKLYEELFNFEHRCYDCLKGYLKSKKLPPGQSYFHPMPTYHIYVLS